MKVAMSLNPLREAEEAWRRHEIGPGARREGREQVQQLLVPAVSALIVFFATTKAKTSGQLNGKSDATSRTRSTGCSRGKKDSAEIYAFNRPFNRPCEPQKRPL